MNIEHIKGLASLLVAAVDDGASLGFLPPLDGDEATEYWQSALTDDVILWAAELDGKIVGTVQLQLATKANGTHRAEIAKLMVHPDCRRLGIARALMHTAEQRARDLGRTLLVLDTRAGDPSNLLYQSIGFIEGGKIPEYCKSASGELDATVIYYKLLK